MFKNHLIKTLIIIPIITKTKCNDKFEQKYKSPNLDYVKLNNWIDSKELCYSHVKININTPKYLNSQISDRVIWTIEMKKINEQQIIVKTDLDIVQNKIYLNNDIKQFLDELYNFKKYDILMKESYYQPSNIFTKLIPKGIIMSYNEDKIYLPIITLEFY